ncbi:MAG: transcription elongation factor GreB [Halobacteriovoraceae bacterium]|nr:transcription elongation factor GreB [Halobacteriovoraceae bacterium]|tara:strand:+ start:11450 stop:11935 length:486 start_codon:yes stop_codon:yes gene_type:complete
MPAKKDNYITPKGHQALVDELNQLVLTERPEIIKVIQWAASLGDRSENADYLYGKKRLREIDKRSNFLRKRIEKAVIINPAIIKSEVVKFGATVTVINEDENEIIYTIVGQDEIDTKNNRISWRSPIGKALMGKEVGDDVEVKTPSGTREFEISDIVYQEL